MQSCPFLRSGCLLVAALITLPVVRAGAAEPVAALKAAEGLKQAPEVSFGSQVLPILKKYCVRCHGGTKPKGGLNLARFTDEAAAAANRKLWPQVVEYVEAGDMPPEGQPQPTSDEVAVLSAWVGGRLEGLECGKESDPGRVTIRRLNRAEYNNTIRDLVGVDFHPADDFPSDDVGYGFDNIGDVLTLPPILMERYLAAAEDIAERAIVAPETHRKPKAPESGPAGSLPASHRAILFRTPDSKESSHACAEAILERFTSRAYRRPATPGEVARLVKFVDLAMQSGDSFERGIQLAVEAVLVSPQFLFRVELDPRRRRRGDPGPVPASHPINEFELASRLSYFLWSSLPDEPLSDLARQGKLREGDNLEVQVRRMLADPKARALVENFADQWLQIRNLRTINPDRGRFPTFDEPLRAAMQQETERFFEAVMREDRSVLDFLDADFTFLNERLARHYGIEGVKGNEFRRVKLEPGSNRGGLLAQASILTVTSNPTRTSPVKRGKWILEQVLGTPPPPPPPDVPELKDDSGGPLAGTLRQRMEQHRSNPACASCHGRMDPLGFGFENYDAIGAWRDQDGGHPIDSSGMLPAGESFRGPAELKQVLKGRQRDFTRCLAEKMLTYAIGRGIEESDGCAIDRIVDAVAADQFKFSRLVLEIVNSDPFQRRRNRGGGR
jgi:hypothetical protein